MASIKICKLDDVPPGKMAGFTIRNEDIVVANINGEVHCLAGRCPHAGAPLKEAKVENWALQCPWHDARFDIRTGTPLGGPPNRPLKVFHCTIKGPYVYLELPTSATRANEPDTSPSGSRTKSRRRTNYSNVRQRLEPQP